jgi:sulfur carrier protein
MLSPLFIDLYNDPSPMNVTVNGEPRDLPAGETVRALVTRYNLTPEKVAIELNRRLLRSERYDVPLNDGDEIEIVTFVGGG